MPPGCDPPPKRDHSSFKWVGRKGRAGYATFPQDSNIWSSVYLGQWLR